MSSSFRYEFTTNWEIPASQSLVWTILNAPGEWPSWWRGVECVDLIRPAVDSLGLHAVRRYTWRSRLPYRLTFVMETTRVEPETLIAGEATGELEGYGCWQLSQSGGVTFVRYD